MKVLVFSKGKWTYNKQMQERTGGGLSRSNTNSILIVNQKIIENLRVELKKMLLI